MKRGAWGGSDTTTWSVVSSAGARRSAALPTVRTLLCSTIVRALLAIVVGSAGCLSGLIEGGTTTTSVPPADPVSQMKWTGEALPAFHAATCFNCHTSSAGGAWLAGQSDADIRASLLGYTPQVVDLGTPASSNVLTKGMHEGPQLQPDQAAAILDWISAEHDALAGTGTAPPIETPKFAPLLCTSTDFADPACVLQVPLSVVAPGITGATLQMIVHTLGSGLYMSHLYIDGGATGVHLEHPLFVAFPADPAAAPIVDALDRFADVKLDVTPTTGTCPSPGCVPLDDGFTAFVAFPPDSQLAISFKALSAPM